MYIKESWCAFIVLSLVFPVAASIVDGEELFVGLHGEHKVTTLLHG